MSEKWIILDGAQYNTSQACYHTTQIAKGIMRSGLEGRTFQIGGLAPQVIYKMMMAEQPQVVLMVNNVGMNIASVLQDVQAAKCSLWFDEPVSRVLGIMGNPAVMDDPKWKHMIWDGYWRTRAQQLWYTNSGAIHLAANENEFWPAKLRQSDDVVFIGALHSPAIMEQRVQALCGVEQRMARIAANLYMPFLFSNERVPDWESMIGRVLLELDAGSAKTYGFDAERRLPDVSALWTLLWEMGKNVARIRILRRAIKVAPVRFMSDFNAKTLDHASIAEVRGMVGDWGCRLVCHDTSHYCGCKLGGMYQYGRLHINATDPQSVDGGLPYRIFQTAMSGQPLITEECRELPECYNSGTEIITYTTPDDFEAVLSKTLAMPRDELEHIGELAHNKSYAHHQWHHRISDISAFLHQSGAMQYQQKAGDAFEDRFRAGPMATVIDVNKLTFNKNNIDKLFDTSISASSPES